MRRLSFAYHFVYLLLCLLLAYSAVVVAYNLELGHEEEKFKKEAAKAKMYQKFADDELEAAQNQSGLLFMFMGLMSADNDGDNLDLQKEVALGTDDNLIDSDGDEIPDGKDKHPAGGDQVWSIKIPWQHKGSDYSTEIAVNEDTYWYYHDKKRGSCCEDWDRFVTPNNTMIKSIAQDIADISLSTREKDKAGIAISFVQSLLYEFDISYSKEPEWPKYPIETLVDKRGDCEDTAFLMSSILEALGFDTVILVYYDHVALGLACGTCKGKNYEFEGKKFFFVESTEQRAIGDIKPKYARESPQIIG